MTRREEELLYNNLKVLKNFVIDKYDITDDEYISDIELVLMELLEFGCYIDFDVEIYEIFNIDEIIEFLDFYEQRTHANCVVPMIECVEILEMLFDIEL